MLRRPVVENDADLVAPPLEQHVPPARRKVDMPSLNRFTIVRLM
jgi:hypothetical protein